MIRQAIVEFKQMSDVRRHGYVYTLLFLSTIFLLSVVRSETPDPGRHSPEAAHILEIGDLVKKLY